MTNVQRPMSKSCMAAGKRIGQWSMVIGHWSLAIATCSPVLAESPQLLRYKFRPNEIVRFEVEHKVTIDMKKGEAEETARHATVENKHFRVVSVDANGAAIIEPVIDRVRMTARFGGHPEITWDSNSDKQPPPPLKGVGATIGRATARMKFSCRGELISSVPVLPARLQARVAAGTGPATPENDASKNFLVVFPEQPVGVGDEWSDTDLEVSLKVTPSLSRKFRILRRYRLESLEDGRATISLRSAPLQPVSEPQLRAQLIQRLPAGTIVFDLERGLIVHRRLTIDEKVVGFAEADSRLHVKSVRTERLRGNVE